MRCLVLTFAVAMLGCSLVMATEPVIFHTAHFNDDTIVSLSLVTNGVAGRVGYDYDVTISLSQTHPATGASYRDPGKHKALVKCGEPARVHVRGIDYPIPTSGAANGADWKDDLWRAVCTPPVS